MDSDSAKKDIKNARGMLYLCATPIGNLKDITERVKETLGAVDIIAAEDTRNSIRLLNHFGIKTPMTSYHEHNKYDKADTLIAQMMDGKDVALITDAGTPAISDPGEVLVRRCHEEGITVTSLPGACACITALTLSGLNTRRFVFEGFLPYDKKERQSVMESLKDEHRTVIMYEAPHHLKKTLSDLIDTIGDRRLTICRELTKKFESVTPTTLGEAVSYYEDNEPRGEYVLVIEGRDPGEIERDRQKIWEDMSVEDHMALYLDAGMDRKEAMKKVASDRGVSKREIYEKYSKKTS
ncbi:16S rRNA (cytidine1402-2'-O)-methyltransferase [Lachnospiraceae bacterium XBB2008]|nr:16S rRNA (cytidine1402-2'-O)-methyltransferase [Lachnospiraceae bacterium XBB2008]